MSVAITIRDVPDEVRDELAARAGRAGKSLQEYLRGMLVDTAARPPVDDVIARARARVGDGRPGRNGRHPRGGRRRPAVSPGVVCDASALVVLLLDDGSDGRWVTGVLTGADLAAPSPVAFEAANIIRRQGLAGLIGADQAAQAHADLLDLAIEHWPYEVLAPRAWELRGNLSPSTTRATSPWPSSPVRRSSPWTAGSPARPASGVPRRRRRGRHGGIVTPDSVGA